MFYFVYMNISWIQSCKISAASCNAVCMLWTHTHLCNVDIMKLSDIVVLIPKKLVLDS
jgi:hypothetical protein